MYQIKVDGQLFYDPRLPDYGLAEAQLQQEINRAGTLALRFYDRHPMYGVVKRLKSSVEVSQDSVVLYRGRVLNEDFGFYNDKKLTCEGALAYLNDSIVRPYSYKGSVQGYVQQLVDQHNAQVQKDRQLKLGRVTVSDGNDYITRASSDYPNTLDEMQNKMIKLLGGYLMLRYESVDTYIDYLADTDIKNLQDVEFGKNLIDLTRTVRGQDVATAVIPLGAKIEGSDARVTIASVNSGLDYVSDPEAVELHGLITKTVMHDDVTLPENLIRKGKEDLADLMHPSETINVTAADLSAAGYDVQSFRFGRYERVISSPHGTDEYMLVSKMSTNLLDPGKNKLTLGVTRKSFTERQNNQQHSTAESLSDLFKVTDDAKKDLAEISNKKMYRLLTYEEGSPIFTERGQKTTVYAVVMSWDDDVTSDFDASAFFWHRISADPEADAEWDSYHAGMKSIVLTSKDFTQNASFYYSLDTEK